MSICEDRIILKKDPAFLLKVSSGFHRSQDILLPTFYSAPANKEEEMFSRLDISTSLLLYSKSSKEFRRSDSLFIVFLGARRGQDPPKLGCLD